MRYIQSQYLVTQRTSDIIFCASNKATNDCSCNSNEIINTMQNNIAHLSNSMFFIHYKIKPIYAYMLTFKCFESFAIYSPNFKGFHRIQCPQNISIYGCSCAKCQSCNSQNALLQTSVQTMHISHIQGNANLDLQRLLQTAAQPLSHQGCRYTVLARLT